MVGVERGVAGGGVESKGGESFDVDLEFLYAILQSLDAGFGGSLVVDALVAHAGLDTRAAGGLSGIAALGRG